MRCKYCGTPLQAEVIRFTDEEKRDFGWSMYRGLIRAYYCPNDNCTVKPCTDYYRATSSVIREAQEFALDED